MTLAPVSPSMRRSLRSSGRSARAAPMTGAMATPIASVPSATASGMYTTQDTLMRRPGARSSRLAKFAASAIRTASVRSLRPLAKPGVATSTTATPAPPNNLMKPVVRRPSARARTWPRKPRSPGTPRRSSTNPRKPNPNAANRTRLRDNVRPGSSPRPAAPAIARPASMTSTVSTMTIPPAVGSEMPR